ncbi:1,4-beta-D-glucan glucohydrolase [Tsuneonella deserti]|uniref:1,4-beta-D-glucan glucohydrolase n=1 Tax=Tsuneonella deserti TaxID=2035528 RepID=A0ABQ1RY03_9SPHN|nr:glycoside hydrolase family 3 protein [Tsuneonella deserti]GGD84852.1 1,4-beta-D-glucan glucohydrolase [Tsuneonella deserti]
MVARWLRGLGIPAFAALTLTGCAGVQSSTASAPVSVSGQVQEAVANPSLWPAAHSPVEFSDQATEAEIGRLLQTMTLEQKVGQLIQADIGSISPDDLEHYPLGSILAGGNSGPNGNERASAEQWARLVGDFRAASLRPAANGIAVPIIFGVDAVHGHNNIPGATIFPHNIGLGAARDPDLVRRIGEATAAEVAGTGIEWTFAPTLAVPQDTRWGRTYEGYSSDPQLVARYGAAMVAGLQGHLVSGRPLAPEHVAATAKHFLADGGTRNGTDQGDAAISEAELIDRHAQGYPAAIDAGALTVMASFSSWNGVKNHGNESLLTGVLKQRMGFEGFVVGDWNGHGQVPGCTPVDCPEAILAGLDMFMAPDSWKGLFDSTLASAKKGEIPLARIDDAVRRILRVKFKLDLFAGDVKRGDTSAVGAPAHLALAREAVAKSLVLLKNKGSVLPIRPGARVLVVGPAADDIAIQTGGWTVSWQGTDVTRKDFPNGQTVWEALAKAVREAGGTVVLAPGDAPAGQFDVAIVVYGETPYAEFQGDRPNVDFVAQGDKPLVLLQELKGRGIPTVSLFLSGRPLYTSPELEASDAFVAGWLPGTQGSGIADVLVAQNDGKPRRDFTGTLPFAWPADCGDGRTILFPLGFGGSYARPPSGATLDTSCVTDAGSAEGFAIFAKGLVQGVSASVSGSALPNLGGRSGEGSFTATAFDAAAQEDARELTWLAPAKLQLRWPSKAFGRASALRLRFSIDQRPAGKITISPLCDGCSPSVDLTSTFALAEGKGWREARIPLQCLDTDRLEGLEVAAVAGFRMRLQDLRIIQQDNDGNCRGPF